MKMKVLMGLGWELTWKLGWFSLYFWKLHNIGFFLLWQTFSSSFLIIIFLVWVLATQVNGTKIQGLIFQKHNGSSFENQSQFKYFNYYWHGPKPMFNCWLLPNFLHFIFQKQVSQFQIRSLKIKIQFQLQF